MRYVAYVRISSEEQRGNYSLAAQKHAIETWIARRSGEQAGHLIRLYADECFTGTTEARPALQQMLTDARSGQFDALVVHKWDRLARSRLDAVRYKVMLRQECSIKLFAVEGVSEDEDEFVGMLFEAMIEVWSEFYSRNLSNETRNFLIYPLSGLLYCCHCKRRLSPKVATRETLRSLCGDCV